MESLRRRFPSRLLQPPSDDAIGSSMDVEARLQNRVSLSLKAKAKPKSASAKQMAAQAANAARRRSKWSGMAPSRGDVLLGARSLLERVKIKPTTSHNYAVPVADFLKWCQEEELRVDSSIRIGLSALEYADFMFLEGRPLSAIGTFRAGLLHYLPELRDSVYVVERLKDAQESWSLKEPPATRLPLPHYGAWAVIGRTAQRGEIRTALAMVTQLRTYVRPSELLKLRAADVVAPSSVAVTGMEAMYGLILNAVHSKGGEEIMEDPEPGKTGNFNENMLFDLPDELWVGKSLAKLAGSLHRHQRLFNFSQEQYNQSLKKSLAECQMAHLNATSYVWRHTGVSLDHLCNRRSEQSIKARARWVTDTSVKRYKKATLALRQSSLVPDPVLRYGKEVEAALEGWFFGVKDLPQPSWPLP